MNIVFLDIDGVLNTDRFIIYQIKHHEADGHTAQYNFDPICMKLLKKLYDEFDCKFVISSSWRSDENSMKCIKDNLNMYGIPRESIIGRTCFLGYYKRGEEITKYIEDNNIDKYIIIDDDCGDMIDMKNLVHCDNRFGFRKEQYKLVREIFLKHDSIEK